MEHNLSFATRGIEINGELLKILISNHSSSSALPALANALLLDPRHVQKTEKLVKLVQKNTVSARDLVQSLANIGGKCTKGGSAIDELEQTFAGFSIQNSDGGNITVKQLVQVLSQLNNMDPVFDGSFKDNQKRDIFKLYGVKVLHGWMIDDQEYPKAYEEIAKCSYKEAQKHLKHEGSQSRCVSSFFERSDTQMTKKGLKHLKETIEENSFATLFRNDKFHTIHKQRGQLFTLVTDQSNPEIVWHSLRSVDGVNDSFYKGNLTVIEDDLTKKVRGWLGATISSVSPSYRFTLEIEMKYGVMLDSKTKRRVSLPVSKPTIYTGRQRMRPNVEALVFEEFKKYMHTKYNGCGFNSETEDLTYRINLHSPKPRFLRKRIDSKTGVVEEVIDKKPVSSLFIHLPEETYDMKLSVNLEFPVRKKELLNKCKVPVSTRYKKRVSYFKELTNCRVDITDVEQLEKGTAGKKLVTPTKEIELELFAPDLLHAWQLISEDSSDYDRIVGVFLNTATLLNKKLTSLTRSVEETKSASSFEDIQ